MRGRRILSLLLAGLLQVMPLVRAVIPLPAQGFAPSSWAFVLKLAAGAVALLGSYHTVSGATSIVTPYTVNAQVGTPYNRQLTTSGQTAHSWSASTAPAGTSVYPLTPGLWLTNSNGKIGGTPTVAMVSNITISAWENSGNSGAHISSVFVFTITNAASGGTPPSITTQPRSQTNYVGSNVTFSVTASGTGTLSYQWRSNTVNITGASATSYTKNNLQPADAANYTVVVTNSAGSITSSIAALTVVVPQADLVVACTGPPSVAPGATVSYAVTVTNLGPVAASSVVVSDLLPLNAMFISATGSGVNSSGTVTWPAITSLAAGSSTSYMVTVTAPANGSLTNTVSGTSSTTDPNAANNNGTALAAKVVTGVTPQADITVAVSGPATISASGSFDYTVTVTNLGPSTATNVLVTDTLPPAVSFVSATGGGVPSAGAVTWLAITTLNAGSGTSFTVTVTAPSSGSLTNVVSASSSTPDPVASNNNGIAATSRVVTAVGQQADLIVVKTGATTVLAGSNLTYTIMVTNLGPSAASNVLVWDALPNVVTFVSANSGGVYGSGTVTWPTIISLASGAWTNFMVTVAAPASGPFTNQALGSSSTTDPDASNNNGTAAASQVVTAVVTALGQYSITVTSSTVLDLQTGLYEETVGVTNTGPITVAAVRVYVDGLRAGVQLYNATGTNAGRPYVQYDAPLNPNAGVSFLLEYYVPDRGSFTHTLQAVTTLPAPTTTSSSGSFAITRIFADSSSKFVIEFATTPGHTYTVIYSDDGMATWHAATPSITAAATFTQWIDDGPPKTLRNPASVGSRFYKVIAAP